MGLLLGRALWPGPGIEPAPVATADSPVPVRIAYVNPSATRVAVAGSFNDWDPRASPLRRGDGGVFAITLPLPRGQHEYQLVVDGERWVPDPAAALTRDDGFGGENSVLEI